MKAIGQGANALNDLFASYGAANHPIQRNHNKHISRYGKLLNSWTFFRRSYSRSDGKFFINEPAYLYWMRIRGDNESIESLNIYLRYLELILLNEDHLRNVDNSFLDSIKNDLFLLKNHSVRLNKFLENIESNVIYQYNKGTKEDIRRIIKKINCLINKKYTQYQGIKLIRAMEELMKLLNEFIVNSSKNHNPTSF